MNGPPRVLVLSRNYPNNVLELAGLWVQNLVRESAKFCQPKVVSPMPYCPPLLPEKYSRLRRVVARRQDGGIEVLHPRFLAGPGHSTFRIEWRLYQAAVRRVLDRMRKDFPFDLIHAHFTYPDGVAAVHLGRRYGVPVVITEQNIWGDWMNRHASVRERAVAAARECARLISVSSYARGTIERFTGPLPNLVVIPNGVDGSVFTLPAPEREKIPDQILFAGVIRPVKGVDVLLDAMRILADRGSSVKLILAGDAYYDSYKREELRLHRKAQQLGLADRVRFTGKHLQPELAKLMQQSAALVLPSRSESLGMVLAEAMACGTPVVATRCGGPEEIVTEETGVLAPREDPEALANAITYVLDRHAGYDPARLRCHALERFGLELAGRRLEQVYREVLGG